MPKLKKCYDSIIQRLLRVDQDKFMLKQKIKELYISVLEQTDRKLTVDVLEDSTVMLDSGLDSLGFVILVSVLGEELGFDPFASMQDPFYPQTFGEFVAIYEKHNNNGSV